MCVIIVVVVVPLTRLHTRTYMTQIVKQTGVLEVDVSGRQSVPHKQVMIIHRLDVNGEGFSRKDEREEEGVGLV